MRLLKLACCSCLSFSSSIACFAFDLRHEELPVQLGVFGSSQGKAQDINISGAIGDRFTVRNNNHTHGLFGIGYYLAGVDRERFNLMYGLNGFYLDNAGVSGTIVQEHLFTNLSYHYSIQNIPIYVAAKAKVKTNSEKYSVILDAGIGPNFIQTSGYSNTSLDGITLPDNAFSGHNNVAFTATAGIGLRFNNVFGKAPLECGYRFFYLGQGELSRRTEQLLNTLKTGDSYANAGVCAVTF